MLQRETPDVVALQEADGPSFWSGDFDHVEELASLAGYEHHFHGRHHVVRIARKQVCCGTALLSRIPLANPCSFAFAPSRPTPRKGFVVATVALPGGRELDVVSVHLDFLRKAVRRRQIQAMVRALAHRRNPLVILGDMNCWWRRRNDGLHVLIRELGVAPWEPEARDLGTWPSQRPRLRIDWILASSELDFHSYSVVTDRVSDHCGVLAEIRLRGHTA
jgi:endonuclease/exonuclease/phosphatase family metal-dependent hydrolase